MEHKENCNNHVVLCGKIKGQFAFSHRVFEERFYKAKIEAKRLSGIIDTIPVIVSNSLVNVRENWAGRTVCIEGDMRSYIEFENGKTKLLLYAFAKYFAECEDEEQSGNSVFLSGYISKPPLYRETPLGREITDVFLAVNRPYGKSDYVPCIFWGRNASFAALLEAGDEIKVRGRIQSRQYRKRISEDEYTERTICEVSISGMEVISRDETKDD